MIFVVRLDLLVIGFCDWERFFCWCGFYDGNFRGVCSFFVMVMVVDCVKFDWFDVNFFKW